jgi:hypothetical protein
MNARRKPIFGADVRRLGGIVTVAPCRDRVTSEPLYRVNHVSAGGDIAFTSLPISDETRALEAAEVLAQFVGATVQRC